MVHQKIFEKPALTISEQIALLKERKLIIDNPVLAEHFLQTIGYYRLMAYFKPFLNMCAHHARLWNRFFINTPKNDNTPIIAPQHHWKKKLFELFENNSSIPFTEMGFCNDWRKDLIWEL